jgi:hypothetical protein
MFSKAMQSNLYFNFWRLAYLMKVNQEMHVHINFIIYVFIVY